MRKILFPIAVLSVVLFPLCIHSQARVNAELAIVRDVERELTYARGWRRDFSGQWNGARNWIMNPFGLQGYDSFEKLVIYEVSFNNAEYYLFEVMRRRSALEFPPARESRFEYRESFLYLIRKNDFIIKLNENGMVNNSIPVISNIRDINRWRRVFETTIVSALPSIITPLLNDPHFVNRSDRSFRHYIADTLNIYTFYWTEENVVRFNISGNRAVTAPEEMYFEVPFEYFSNLFNPIIIRNNIDEIKDD